MTEPSETGETRTYWIHLDTPYYPAPTTKVMKKFLDIVRSRQCKYYTTWTDIPEARVVTVGNVILQFDATTHTEDGIFAAAEAKIQRLIDNYEVEKWEPGFNLVDYAMTWNHKSTKLVYADDAEE